MTEKSQPVLGSGALREALAELRSYVENEQAAYVYQTRMERFCEQVLTDIAAIDTSLAALSLSSLPESADHVNCICGQPAVRYAPPRCEQWPKCYLDFSSPTKQDTERGQEIAGELGTADPLKAGSEVREASSEIRERVRAERVLVLEDVITRLQERMGNEEYGHAKAAVALDIEAVEEMKAEAERALAPSRQGAGGKKI